MGLIIILIIRQSDLKLSSLPIWGQQFQTCNVVHIDYCTLVKYGIKGGNHNKKKSLKNLLVLVKLQELPPFCSIIYSVGI